MVRHNFPRLVTAPMLRRSRLTGELKLYTYTQAINTADYFDFDPETYKNELQAYLDSEGVDAQVETCKRIRTTFYDHLIVDSWVPCEEGGGLIPPWAFPIIVKLCYAIIYVASAVIVGYTAISVIGALTELLYGPTRPEKKEWYDPTTGEGPFTLKEYYSRQRAEHPDLWICHYCGEKFATEEERDAHEMECPYRPRAPGVPEWLKWVVVGLGIVVVVPIIGKIAVPMFRKLMKK